MTRNTLARPIEMVAEAVEAAPAGRVHPWLLDVHGAWMQEVLAVVDAARGADAGIWVRWGAVRYLDGAFGTRLRLSRVVLDRLRPFYPDQAAARLWAAGELMDQLRQQLDRSVSLHQSAAEFGTLAVKLLRALGCWCREVEDALGPLDWDALPRGAQLDLMRLRREEDHAGRP